jgi:hypothetical protein
VKKPEIFINFSLTHIFYLFKTNFQRQSLNQVKLFSYYIYYSSYILSKLYLKLFPHLNHLFSSSLTMMLLLILIS